VTRPGAVLLAVVASSLLGASPEAPVRNGFRLEPASVPVGEIRAGGPPRDGIPALDHPARASAGDAGWAEDEPVIGVARHGEARAYPIAILDWHERVNDTLGGLPILVSYCPLCATALVFDRRVGAETRRFGVSGLLYRSALLLYDHESESLWSQIAARAVTGPATGTRLTLVPSRTTRLGDWLSEHPDTTVLTRETGHQRPYGSSPYGTYATSERVIFPVLLDERYHPKMPTVGLRAGDRARAYPALEVVRAGGTVEERFGEWMVRIRYDPELQVFTVDAPAPIEVVEGYWFAWMAFHPESGVFRAAPAQEDRTGSE
jgi:hypothetical protein